MERLIGLAVIAYLIYSFIAAVLEKQQRPDMEMPDDDAPWPHLENTEEARPVDRAPRELSRPDPRDPGPIFWPDLFGDPTRTGTPHGWPVETPETTTAPVHPELQKASDRTDAGERPAASLRTSGETSQTAIRSALAPAEKDLLRRLAEREHLAGVLQQETVTAENPLMRGDRTAFELTSDSLRQAILYMEVLGPPRALRPYRPSVSEIIGR